MSECKWTAKKVRQTFIDYFEKKKGHTHWPSSAVVPYDDPTLLFTNAGMNQYKAIFLGQADPKTDLGKLKRAANSQKCIRAGGKHNDLEDVGKDVYHHTFFEMLGNWSFGDYFKEEAIAMAWELLTEVYKIDKDRLYATYFGGNKDQGLDSDEEAKNIWLKYLPAERVLPYGMKDNFWEMGNQGPCGPCTEIHYDRIGNRFVPERVNADHPDVVEIWNLVFIQYNREPDSSLRSLPAKSVDTGMGFERLTSVLQDVDSNYDTDIFKGIFDAIQKECGCGPYTKKVGEEDKDFTDMAYRVVADHIRTLTFAITDGAAPGSNGRDYVLRRVCRRAVRYGKEKLGAPSMFFNKLVPAVVEGFGDAFPELKKDPQRVQDIIATEEKIFTKTLANGIEQFRKDTAKLKKGDTIPGDVCARLMTTFGFPIDLTELMGEEKGLLVDKKGFETEMQKHQEISKQGGSSKGHELKLEAEQVALIKKMGVSVTDDSSKYDWDSTGTGPKVAASIKAIYFGKADFSQDAKEGKICGLILDKTSFYAIAGGQVWDVGHIETPSGKFEVTEVTVAAGYVLHVGTVRSGTIAVGETCLAEVDYERRALIAKNHTATHIMNFALRDVLKRDVDQKGSEVVPEKLRFDFNGSKPLTLEEIEGVEKVVQSQIKQELPVHRRPTAIADAKKINGLRAVFGEKYPDPVTVVTVGPSMEDILANPSDDKWTSYSIEFCGGTHIANAKEISNFVIVEEGSVQAGSRRIVAYTNDIADAAVALGNKLEAEAKKLTSLKDLPALSKAIIELNERIKGADITYSSRKRLRSMYDGLVSEKKKLQSGAAKAAKGAAVDEAKKFAEDAKASGAKFVVAVLSAAGKAKIMSKAIQAFHKVAPDTAFLCISEAKGKAAAIASIPKGMETALNASKWVGDTLKTCGGKGGGKPNYAQGAAKGVTMEQIDAAVKFAKDFASKAL